MGIIQGRFYGNAFIVAFMQMCELSENIMAVEALVLSLMLLRLRL